MNLKSSLVLGLLFAVLSFSQTQPQIQVPLTFSDLVQTRVVKLGIDPSATDSIDAQLGEEGLPPWPFGLEARFVLPVGNFSGLESYQDYRYGIAPYTGQKEHKVKYQKGQTDSLKILYDLPPQITIDVQDYFGGILVNTQFVGSGSFSIPNPDVLTQLKMIVNYNNAPTSIKIESDLVPGNFALEQNYPNPFNPHTKIQFTLPQEDFVSLKVYNQIGEIVEVLVNELKQSGMYEYNFNPQNLSSGIYYYQLSTNKFTETRKMILQK